MAITFLWLSHKLFYAQIIISHYHVAHLQSLLKSEEGLNMLQGRTCYQTFSVFCYEGFGALEIRHCCLETRALANDSWKMRRNWFYLFFTFYFEIIVKIQKNFKNHTKIFLLSALGFINCSYFATFALSCPLSVYMTILLLSHLRQCGRHHASLALKTMYFLKIRIFFFLWCNFENQEI